MGSNEFLSREEWATAAKRRLGTDELDVVSYELRRMGSAGTGFLGEHRLADVTVQLRDEQRSRHVLKFFVKAQPEALADQKDITDQTGTFDKEVAALSDLFVKFRSLLKNGGEDMKWTCRCFYTRPDVIVLEDLIAMDFQLINSRIETGFQHSALTLRALANLHAASLIFEESQPVQPFRLGTERADVLSGGFFQRTPGHPGLDWMNTGVECVWKLVEEIHGQNFLRNVKTQIQTAMFTLFDLKQTSERFRNVMCHGDLWRNNIFFRLVGNEPVEALLVDFQVVRYAPPAVDVACAIYLSTRRAFRAEYCQQLLKLYYDHLSQNLREHGFQPENVLSWQDFQHSWNVYKKLGVVITPCYNVVTHIKEENIRHVFSSSVEFERFVRRDRSPEVLHAFKTDKIFREKIEEVIEELLEECTETK